MQRTAGSGVVDSLCPADEGHALLDQHDDALDGRTEPHAAHQLLALPLADIKITLLAACVCLLLLMSGALVVCLLHLPLPSAASSPSPQPAQSAAAALPATFCERLPVCRRTLVLDLRTTRVGFTSRIDQLLQSAIACLREFDNRVCLVDDREWNYFSLSLLFTPAPPALPVLRGWNDPDTNQTLAVMQQLQWPPVWSARRLRVDSASPAPPPSPINTTAGTGRAHLVSDALSIDPQLSPELETALASAYSAAEVRFDPEADSFPALLLRQPGCAGSSTVDLHNGFCSAAYRSEYMSWDWGDTRSAASRRKVRQHPHVLSAAPYGYQLEWSDPLRLQMVTGDLLTNTLRLQLSLSSPHLFPSADRGAASPALQSPPVIFMLKQRMLHLFFTLRAEHREQAALRLRQWKLRSRGAVWEQIMLELRGRAQTLSRAAAPDAPAAPSLDVYGRVNGSGSIAVHIRRQDKRQEAEPVALAAYIQAAEHIVGLDHGLRASFPPLPAELREQCGSAPHVQLIVLTDDPTVVPELAAARPCWRLHLPYEPDKQLERRGASDQLELPSALKRVSAERLMVELVLASEADYAVVTYSSNIGRLLAINRGWRDSHWEGRVVSVDVPWYTHSVGRYKDKA